MDTAKRLALCVFSDIYTMLLLYSPDIISRRSVRRHPTVLTRSVMKIGFPLFANGPAFSLAVPHSRRIAIKVKEVGIQLKIIGIFTKGKRLP